MPEENTVTEEQTAPETVTTEEAKTFTQADLDRIVSERLAREKARFADYDDIKVRAEKATELEQRLTEVTAQAEAAKLQALRTSIAAQHGVPLKTLTGTTEEELTEQAKELLEWRGAPAPVKRETNSSGNTGSSSGTDVYERAAMALRNK